jgi:hypothetical protein
MQHISLNPKLVSSRDLGKRTLEEAFTGVKIEMSYFCIFGCPIYIHILVEKWTKLEYSNMNDLFVGYSETSKAYRVYILEQRKTLVSRDVKFEEDFASREYHEPIPVIELEELESPNFKPRSLVNLRAVQQHSCEEEETIPFHFCHETSMVHSDIYGFLEVF